MSESDFIPLVRQEPIHVNKSTDPSDVIATTQGIRLRMVHHRMSKGITDDSKELALDLQLLRDLDSAALTTRKIDVEAAGVNEAAVVNQNVRNVIKLLQGKNPAEVTDASQQRRETPKVDEKDLPAISLVHNHTLQGTEELDYADFVDIKSAAKPAPGKV